MPGRETSPERFLTTVVMTDIVGSTEHAAELGDNAWREFLQQHHALIRTELRRHGGREMDTAGDGFFVIFDAPAQAVGCVLAMAKAVRGLGIEIRAGVHVGEVQQMAGKVTGIAVVIASRIMAGGGGGDVLVSSTVRDLVAGSGLTFEDRGVRQLKGVPDEWRVYSVRRPEAEAVAPGQPAVARVRRAAAVRRAQARPIWQRRPRLAAAIAGGLAIPLVATSLLVWQPWRPATLTSVSENSIGIIDPERREVIGQIAVGTRPGGIAVGDGYAWVANTGSDTVSQIDLETGATLSRINVGRSPAGIAVAEGSVWVANSADRTITRINAKLAEVVGAPIQVGNGPTAIAAAGPLLWVANSTDSTVVAVDARTGEVGQKTGVGAAPIALAADATAVWVVSEDGASVTQLDPLTGATLTAPIQLAVRPTGVALDADSVWVTGADGTITQIDRAANRIRSTLDIGGSLTAIAVSGDWIWVGSQGGKVYRVAPAGQATTSEPISIGSAVGAIAEVDGKIWLAAQALPASHRGGTLRVLVLGGLPALDPLEVGSPIPGLEADGLVGYRRTGGAAGTVLLPALASAIPEPTNGGLTYSFRLRPDLIYSTGAPVRAVDFRRAIERSFLAGDMVGPYVYAAIVGAGTCETDGETRVTACDLSTGIEADDANGVVTFRLSEPDPEFVAKLALPYAFPVPDGVGMNEVVEGTFPGTGPYVVARVTETEVVLARNSRFTVFDAAARPDGFPDEIAFALVGNSDLSVEEVDGLRIGMIERGEADLTSYRIGSRTSPELFAPIKTRYPAQWKVGSVQTLFVSMNASVPPFDRVDARRALNYAIDRAQLAELNGGLPDAAITCQLLAPGWPGYQPYCPYTRSPDDGGRWSAPDLTKARQLVDASGTRGAEVVVGPAFLEGRDQLDYLATVLTDLGYVVSVDYETDREAISDALISGRTQVTINGWLPPIVAPSTFLHILTCDDSAGIIHFCDETFDAAYEHAVNLQTTDRAAALAEWAALDHLAVDLAMLAPLVNPGADFVSERVGNYQYSPAYEALFDQMWVQ
ncbi:MAG: ABC transporter substrate-binding protein [Chloroflexota bacterium]